MPSPDFTVQFLLSHNLPGSVTRIAADTANVLAGRGVPVTILFPAVDWWDYHRFCLSRMRGLRRWKHALRLGWHAVTGMLFRRRWCGLRHHAVHPAVRTRRFLLTPSARGWSRESVTVVHPPYVLPHLLRTLPPHRIAMVGAIHVNLEQAMQSDAPDAAAWFAHWVAGERLLAMARYTTSRESQAACERLGIPIRAMIPNGIDLHLFRPAGTRPGGPLTITLYCDPNVQKGREVGVEALRGVKAAAPEVRLRSLGLVTGEQARLFDENLGYLHGEAYAEALRGSDVFVYPSRYDGFPAPPLQAMASGAALVTTAVAGVKEYAVHEENALVCTPGDAAALREQVLRLVRDAALRERLQRNGPHTAAAFSVEQTTAQLMEFLSEVYEEQRSGVTPMVAA